MLSDNLMILRNIHGYSQEELAGQIGISRQAYAKWESGTTLPDIEKCAALADLYGISIDSLWKTESVEGVGRIPPAPKGKNIWGSVSMNDRGQIVIPKAARDKFGLKGGDRLIVGSDEVGIALFKAEAFETMIKQVLELAAQEA